MFEKWYRKMEPCSPSLQLLSKTHNAQPELAQVLLWSQGSASTAAGTGFFGLAAALPQGATTLPLSATPRPPDLGTHLTGGQQGSSLV